MTTNKLIYALHSSFLILDDLMDESETRRGAPCWYKNEGVGMEAINDGFLVQSGFFEILKKYFSAHHCYLPVVELFCEIIMEAPKGQSLDTTCIINGKPLLDLFTMERYYYIVKRKTACYFLEFPVALAMCLSGKYDSKIQRKTKTILLEMGYFFQVQDDFLDCYGDSEVTGKIGTDIRDGKCSWLVVVALERANPAQKKILEDHYGKPDPESEAIVRNLYEELGVRNAYYEYEEDSFNIIRTQIQQISNDLLHKFFLKCLGVTYRRKL